MRRPSVQFRSWAVFLGVLMKSLTKILVCLCLSVSITTPVFSSSLSDDELLNLIEKKAFNYFWQEVNPANGLVRDKTNNFKAGGDPIASVATVGFALTALPIGVERRWITRQQAYDRVLTTLKFFKSTVAHEHGFFYHFVDIETG